MKWNVGDRFGEVIRFETVPMIQMFSNQHLPFKRNCFEKRRKLGLKYNRSYYASVFEEKNLQVTTVGIVEANKTTRRLKKSIEALLRINAASFPPNQYIVPTRSPRSTWVKKRIVVSICVLTIL